MNPGVNERALNIGSVIIGTLSKNCIVFIEGGRIDETLLESLLQSLGLEGSNLQRCRRLGRMAVMAAEFHHDQEVSRPVGAHEFNGW